MTLKKFKHYSDWPKSEWPWTHFSPGEMASKREGELHLDTDAMDKLERLRVKLGRPILITSAYRSPAHNRAVGGAKNSYHMKGMAFDVRMENHDPHEFEAAARSVGFTGFGYYVKNGFMHIDTGPSRSWGKPWPRNQATNTPKEPPRVPERLREDKEAKAAAGAGVSSGVAVALEAAPAASSIFGKLTPVAQTIAILATVAFVGYLIWSKVRK